ncbi:hypothetical protein ACFLSQ_03115 [Bacteroidota bacterium]
MKTCLFKTVLMITALIIFFACAEDDPTKPINIITGIKVLDTTLQSSTEDAVIELVEKITINIPKENISDGTKLTIFELKDSEIPVDTSATYHSAYDIKLSNGSEFEKPITITINFDETNFPDKYIPGIIGAAWYNEDLKKWTQYTDAIVDTVSFTVTYQTNHLSLHAVWTRWGFWYHRNTEHFNVYWKGGTNAPMSNYEYDNHQEWHETVDPEYIQDMCQYLEQAYTAYKNLGLYVPSKIDMWVQPMDGDGEFSWKTHNISVNTHCNGGTVTRPAKQAMPMAVVHEFMHYLQDYYYSFTPGVNVRWWLEATATQADRMVWPNNSIFESIDYSNNELDLYVHTSWDDSPSSAGTYVAGGFLSYLSAYRPGKKANIASLIKLGGEFGISYIRTMIDDYLKDFLSSEGIGYEYAQYLKAAYEETIPITFKNENIYPGVDVPCDINVFLTNSNTKHKVNYQLPYLSGKFIKIQMHEKNDIPRSLKIIPATLPDDIKAFLYYDGEYQREIAKGEEIKTIIHTEKGGIAHKNIHILLVNTSKDNNANVEFEIEMQKFDNGHIEVKHKIDGYALGKHGNDAMFEFSGEVIGKNPISVESIKHEANDYMTEYPQRILTVKLSPGAYIGVVKNPVIKFEEPPELEIDSSMKTPGYIWKWKGFKNGTITCMNALTFETETHDFDGEKVTLDGFWRLGDMEIRSNVESEYEPIPGSKYDRTYNYIVRFQLE